MSVQWQTALDHANTVRFAVATEKAAIRRLPRREAFHRAADLLEANEDPVNAIRVDWLLLSIPKIGPEKMRPLLTRIGASGSRRVRDLTDRQRRVLASELRRAGDRR